MRNNELFFTRLHINTKTLYQTNTHFADLSDIIGIGYPDGFDF